MSQDTPASVNRRLAQYVYPYRWGALLTIAAYLGVAGTEVMLPKLIGYAFGEGFAGAWISIEGSSSSDVGGMGRVSFRCMVPRTNRV